MPLSRDPQPASILATAIVFGAVFGLLEMHAAWVSTGSFDAPAALAVVVYDTLGFAFIGVVLAGLARLRILPLRGPATPALLLALLLILRFVVNAIFTAKNWGGTRTEALILGFGAGGLGALVLLLLLWRIVRRSEPLELPTSTLVLAVGALLYTSLTWRMELGFRPVVAVGGALVTAALTAAAWWLGGRLPRAGAWAAVAVLIAVPPVVRAAIGPTVASQVIELPGPTAAAPEGAENVVLVVLDTLRADHLEIYGYARETMPGLARFAQRAAVYEDCSSASAWTLPGHASLFTGLYSRSHGANRDGEANHPGGLRAPRPLAEGHVTLAESLRDHGYFTGGIASNWIFLGPNYGLAQGFAYWNSTPAYRGALLDGYAPILLRSLSLIDALPIRALLNPLVRADVSQLVYRRAEAITDDAIALLDGPVAEAGRPFLLFLNYMDAHEPYLAPRPFADRFPGRVEGWPRRKQGRKRFRHAGRERMHEHIASVYDSELAYLDHHLERLLSHLESSGRLEDTIVIVTADHGESLYDRGMVEGHGSSLYQEQIHVPLVAFDPRAEGGSRVADPVDHRFLFKWLLERLEVPLPTAVAASAGPTVSELYTKDGLDELTIRRNALKYTNSNRGESRLFDLEDDPGERTPLGENFSEAPAILSALERWRSEVARSDAGSVEMSDTELERLRALGYVQ